MVVRFLATQEIQVDKAIIDARTAPYQYHKWTCRLICVRDFLMLKLARNSVKIMMVAFPPNRYARDPKNAAQEYERIRRYLPQIESVKIPNMMHGEFVMMHPEEFMKKAMEFLQ